MLLGSASAAVVCTLAFAMPALAQTPDADDTAVDEVVVTARRAALESATELKRNSDTMIDSVNADEAGKLPDNSITEVLQRVAGVTMVRFGALGDPDAFSIEGSGIQVRGLSGTTGLLNGREIFSANGGSGISWGEVTPELMAGVDVYKANRADMIEGGTGGLINLRTKMPFDFRKPSVEGSYSITYADMVRQSSPSASILLADRWDTPIGEIGLVVDFAYSDFYSKSSFQRAEPYYKRQYQGKTVYVPGGFNYGDANFRRTRKGIYEALQWRPNDNLTIFQTFFQTQYESNNNAAGVFVGTPGNTILLPAPGSASQFDENGFLISADNIIAASPNNGAQTNAQPWGPNCNQPYGRQATAIVWGPNTCAPTRLGVGSNRNFSSAENITRDFSQGFTWTPTERLRVDGALQFIDSSARSRSFGMGLGSTVSGFSFDQGDKLPQFTINDPEYLANRANYIWDSIPYRTVRNHGGMGAANLDVDFKIGDGFFKTVSAGVRYADRSERDSFNGTYWAPVGRGWNNSAQRTLLDGSVGDSDLYQFDNFFKGESKIPAPFYLPSTSLLTSYDTIYAQKTYGFPNENLCYGTGGTPQMPRAVPCAGAFTTRVQPNPDVVTELFGSVHTEVTTKAAYVQTKFGSDTGLFGVPFTGNFGVRIVENKIRSNGPFGVSGNNFYLTQADANADLADGVVDQFFRIIPDPVLRTIENKYTKVLPSLNLNFKPTETIQVRFAANITMSPPGYNDIRATANASAATTPNSNNIAGPGGISYPAILTGFTASTGNPLLKPTMSTNFDAAIEWYPSRSTTAHLSLFHKSLKDLIYYGDVSKPFVADLTNGANQIVQYSTVLTSSEVINASEKAKINGVEFGGRTFFDMLPGAFKGLGIEANYTYIDSENPSVKALGVNGQLVPGVPIVGLSRDTYNVVLMYEYKKISTRLAYNWRSQYLTSTNANGTSGEYCFYPSETVNQGCPANVLSNTTANPTKFVDISLPVYADPYGSLDFNFSYQATPEVRLWLSANNVSNEIQTTSMGGYLDGAQPIRSWFMSDRRYTAGLNFRF